MRRNRLLWSAVCLALALVLATTGTFAWLSKQQTADGVYTVLSDFDVAGTLSFQSGDQYVPYVAGDEVLADISFDPAAANYIGNMRYVVTYTGASPALIRVRMLEQWLDPVTNEIRSADYLDYYLPGTAAEALPQETDTIFAAGPGADSDALAESGRWVDHRAEDYCYYYSVPVQPNRLTATTTGTGDNQVVTSIGDGKVELTLIDQTAAGADTAAMIQGIDRDRTQLSLLIQVEAVQPNRYREFWGISSLPEPENETAG